MLLVKELNMHRTHRPKGFTLVELLVVISIIALLIAILLPSLKKARDQAKQTVCLSNMHQFGLGINYYMEANKDRLPFIKGDGAGNTAPYRQYQMIFRLWPYIKELEIYQCPEAFGSDPQTRKKKSVLEYPPTGPGGKGFYRADKGDEEFVKMWESGAFPFLTLSTLSKPGQYLDTLYTEYWFNDWSQGATGPQGEIPGVNGSLLNRIPFPNMTVMMADALHEVPRHRGGKHVLFVDAHVEYFKQDRVFDLDPSSYENATDRDSFGNRPYWSWGLGKGSSPIDGAQNYTN